MTTVLLCGIVLNEASCIAECLDTFRPVIDKLVITDTGSTDGTPEVIRAWMTKNNVPGVVYEMPWSSLAEAQCLPRRADGSPPLFDFARARNTAVALAVQHAEYYAPGGPGTEYTNDWLFEIDGAWKLRGGVADLRAGLESAPAKLTGFEVMVNQIGWSIVPYLRLRRVRECGPRGWQWHAPIHEYIFRPDNAQIGRIEGIWIDHEDTTATAANRLARLQRDLVIFDEMIADFEARGVDKRPGKDHERGEYTRAVFFRGQTLDGLGRVAEAYEAFVKRAGLRGSIEEMGQACYRAGRDALKLDAPEGKGSSYWPRRACEWFLKAFAVSGRPEGLWEAAALMSPNEGAVCAQLAFEAAKAQKPDAGGFSIPSAYALAHFGPARDEATIVARLRQMRLLGVASAGDNLDRQGESA